MPVELSFPSASSSILLGSNIMPNGREDHRVRSDGKSEHQDYITTEHSVEDDKDLGAVLVVSDPPKIEIKKKSSDTVAEDEWEKIPTATSTGTSMAGEEHSSFESDMVVVVDEKMKAATLSEASPKRLLRQRSSSTPDLRLLGGEDEGASLEVVPEDQPEATETQLPSSERKEGTATAKAPSVAPAQQKVPSFADMVRSLQSEVVVPRTKSPSTTLKPKRHKMKPRFVVTPIKRCSKSTGDLMRLAASSDDDDEDIVMGDTDAQDFYHRKAKGARSRIGNLKLRPDEAKRKDMILYKKSLQRKAQQRS